MESKVPQLIAVSTDSSASSLEDLFDAERQKKLDSERQKEEKEEYAQEQRSSGVKEFISSIGDRVVAFYDSSFLAVQPPRSWNQNLDFSAAVLSNPLFMCAYVDDKVCGYVDDRVDQRGPQQPHTSRSTAVNTEAQVQFHQGLDIPVKSTDQLLNEICETTIAKARKEFLTREALEDAINMNVEAAEAGNEQADEELRRLFPLRFVLPTAADMTEMIEALQKKKTNAMRHVNMIEANKIQAEIDELEYQVQKEETYILKREISQTECVACEQKFSIQEIKPGDMLHCKECRLVFSNDNASETFTLTQRPLKSSLSITVVRKGKGRTPLIPTDNDLVAS
eukprot:scaffold12756_cov117-Skeletonema_dohrnii-CCMP3373.AAC.2